MSASQRGTPFPAGRAQAPARVSSRRSTPAGYPSASERHSTRTPGQGQPTPTNTVSPARGPPLTPALPVSEGDVEMAPQAVPASTNQGDGTGPAVQVKPMTAKYLSSVWIAVIGVAVLNHGFRKVLSRPPITSGDISIAAVQWYSPKLLFLAHLLSHLSSSMAINAGMIVYLSFFLNELRMQDYRQGRKPMGAFTKPSFSFGTPVIRPISTSGAVATQQPTTSSMPNFWHGREYLKPPLERGTRTFCHDVTRASPSTSSVIYWTTTRPTYNEES
ncbi:hypothetical protein PISMIDRAFT_7198 [Pisolithus microcarpus 441]|uniref:Uncharacterized protein n=1 Tax=Pisolithus microcarpus 441 TaxID=765257 RepID=A0A0C9YUK5_9AGAM|nr:hypothetical protein BKA83DRAFT_7198 [Pisolithus microcarpus]KIK28710.1 hypothetical protein PISMIDRAFT_7198 [Pisolithus microcarpus 441]